MTQVKEDLILDLKTTVQDIANLIQFLETGKQFFITAETQQEVAILEIRKKLDSVKEIIDQMRMTLKRD